MWRVTSFLGKFHLSSLPFFNVNAALHTYPSRNLNPLPSSDLLNLTRHDVLTLISVRCKTGFDRVDDAHVLFRRMLAFEPLPSVADFSRLLNGVVKMNEFSCAVILYKEMRFVGVPIDGLTMNIAINCFCHLNRVDFGLAILADIFKLGFKPTVVTLTTLIRGLFKADQIVNAVQLFRMMVIHKVCNETTYGTVISGMCKSGHTSTAIELLHFVEKEGSHMPDTVMYNTIIASLCKDRKVDKALELLSEMTANAIPSNIVTYSPLIQGLCNFGRWKEVICLITEMTNNGIYPDTVTFNILVDAFSKQGWVEEAEDMLKVMVERGVRPDIVTYNALMDGYCLRGEMKKAFQVLHNMVDRQPDIQSYNILLNGFCKKGNVVDALDLFKVIYSKGMKCDVFTFNTMVHGLFDTGRCADAKRLIGEMHSQRVSPDSFTYGIWLYGLCKNGLASEAHALLCELENSNVSLSKLAYSVVIQGLFEEGKLSLARNLLDKFPSLGFKSNVITCNAMMKGHEGLLEDAKVLLTK